ncbi:MAG TPA: sigma-70 family RNA polymerase sigma factor [Blastocatellia bacterium]|nr:sigma-70 family RNA polymerase sigma factor [Blastocatellia bacterium]HMX24320.1 sigma-70 family RNA polymerase sigma factor [Blastocatellia bacterium]HMZ19724.1 sigma-70 family RNA polymerase sigma factor [Blastocatellia bacterium]HNG33126.1 sigma-70 family RNA polymerase sigma factor [Blastocatellia bacterium]
MSHSEDHQLIAQYLRREREAVGLIEEWIARASAPFRARLGAHWEDTLQEIRIETTRLLERGDWRGKASLKTYLWRVANHACLRQLRRQTRTACVDLDSVDEAHLPRAASPLDQLLEREESFIALRVLDALPAECRNVLQMIAGGASYQELSLRLQTAEGTLRVRVLRCRKRAVELRAQWLSKKSAAAL